MKSAASAQAGTIFLALSSVPPAARAQALDERCGGDAALRAEVERLLDGLDTQPSVVDAPIAGLTAHDGQLLAAGTDLGGFVIIRHLGTGATGVVYLATQQHPTRVVALKVLRREFVASVVQRRFEIEAELLGRLQHPGIAQVYAAHPGDAATPPFMAIELVNGPPITDYVEGLDLPVADRVELVARICDAVQHAHQRGIIHRDLKPGNVLVDDTGQPKVLDFGVARAVDAPVLLSMVETEAGQLVGTLAYMSPEQVAADPDAIDTRTDVHALGVILFRLLTGQLPFGHDRPSLPELARRIAHDNPPRLSAFDPSLRGDLEIIVSRALAKERERRYASAAGLAADLRRFLGGQPIAAAADSAWYLVRRQVRRYRLALAGSAVVAVALAALALYASTQRARADRVNQALEVQLATSVIERGRLLSLTGNLPIAEEFVWRELFRRPDSRHARWTLWDIYSRQPSLWARVPHATGTQTLRFSPDQRHLLTGGRLDGVLHLVDVESGDVRRTFGTTPAPGIRRTFFLPDGITVLAASEDGSLRLWDSASGTLRREMRAAAPGLLDMALGAGGRYAATVAPRQVRAWDVATGALAADLSALAPDAFTVAVHPSDAVLVTGNNDGTLTALDIAARRVLWTAAAAHAGQVISVAFDPLGGVVASGGVDGALRLWTAAGAAIRTVPTENGRVRNIVFTADGSSVAAAGVWRTRLWNLRDALAPPLDLGASEGATDLHIRADGRFLATCNGGSGLVRLWDLRAEARLDHWTGQDGRITAVAVPAGDTIVTASIGGAITARRIGQAAPIFQARAGADVTAMAASHNGRWLASVGAPGSGAVWDAASGQRIATLPITLGSRAVTFADDDRLVLVGEADGGLAAFTWSGAQLQQAWRLPGSADAEVLALAADGPRVFVAHRNRPIVERALDSGRELRRRLSSSATFALALSPDRRLLAAGTFLGSTDVWDLATGTRTFDLKGPTAVLLGLDFSPDGQLLATASRDGSARLWDVASGQILATVSQRRMGAEGIRFFADGRRVAIGHENGEVEARDLETYFRYAAGQAEHQLRTFQGAGEVFPRAGEVLGWSREVLATPSIQPRVARR